LASHFEVAALGKHWKQPAA